MIRKLAWKTIGVLVFLLAILGVCNLGLWVIDRQPPITFEAARALSTAVPQGGSLDVEFSVFRERVCPVTAKRWLYDSAGDQHSIAQFTTKPNQKAGRETYQRAITIPTDAAPGPATYEVALDYICNPLQTFVGPIHIVSPRIPFTITPSDPPPPIEPGPDG